MCFSQVWHWQIGLETLQQPAVLYLQAWHDQAIVFSIASARC